LAEIACGDFVGHYPDSRRQKAWFLPAAVLEELAMAASEYWFDSQEGLRLFSRVYPAPTAAAPVVLCLHGLMRTGRDFEDLAEHLAARYRVIVPDVRGRGLSARDPNFNNYQIPVYLADLQRLLTGLGAPRVTIIGTSMGGLMAMVLAAMQPQMIAGIVLNDVAPEVDKAGLERIRGYAGKAPPVRDWAGAIAVVRGVYGPALPGISEARLEKLTRAGYREDAQGVPQPDADPMIAEPLKDTSKAAPDLWPLWGAIAKVPMLAIRGEHSDIVSAATLERMRREKPDLRTVIARSRGHAPLLDEPECVQGIDELLAAMGR
jgi:pimeloyl-ACP methyl ester carboxylesterase